MKSSEEVHLSSELFLFHLFSSAVFYSSDYAEEADFFDGDHNPARRSGGFAIRRQKRLDLFPCGFAIRLKRECCITILATDS